MYLVSDFEYHKFSNFFDKIRIISSFYGFVFNNLTFWLLEVFQ